MKHFGDITKLSGYTLPIVDVITGGSPCQDLSVAGKRAGLAGERSGLFMEQIRVVKEMRERDRATGRTGWMVRPRYMVWENVPGAFSSGKPKGADFAAVIEEIIKVAEPGTSVSVCVPNGGWTKSGCFYADDGSWSVAWRVHDAQFWGVPQRRKRISLVADFGGLSAPEILFEREGLSGDSEPCGEEREGTAGATGEGVEDASIGVDVYNQEVTGEVAASLTAASGGTNTSGPKVLAYGFEPGAAKRLDTENRFVREKAPTLRADMGDNQTSVLCLNDQGGSVMGVSEDVTGALRAEEHGHQPIVYENHSQDSRYKPLGDISETVSAKYGTGGNNQPLVVSGTYQAVTGALTPGAHPGSYNGQDAYNDMLIASVYGVSSFGAYKEGTTSLRAQGGDNGGGSENIAVQNAIVRRLTPLECERLQGYPDGWTDIGEWVDSKGKKHGEADSPRYKALGNSIALPFWQWMARRICAQYERTVTMASLFDGIGGFPLVFQRCGAVPIWASEIEEFPIAVTKVRFPE